MLIRRGYKYRIYPTKEQKKLFHTTFGHARFVYNTMLSESKAAYQSGERFSSRNAFNYRLTALKKENPWLCDVDATALTFENDALAGAFKAFFLKKSGFPRFHKKKSEGSYTSKCVNGNIRVLDKAIRLPKAGYVKAVIHRAAPEGAVIKSATVSMNADGSYYASVLFEYETPASAHIVDLTNAIGLDYASDGLFVDHNGNVGTNHKYYRDSHDKLAKAQRKLSRMIEANISGYRVVGSKRYPVYQRPLEECKNIQKQKLKIARISRHIANQRMDNLHKISTKIANSYDVVCVESLNMRAMSNKGFGNGKATLDNGYGMFLPMLEYKLSERGKYLVKVDKWFPSSQICHCCGTMHPEMKDLKVRTMVCDCGLIMDRDQNAAVNILKEGLRLLLEAA